MIQVSSHCLGGGVPVNAAFLQYNVLPNQCNQGFSLRVLEGWKIDRIDRNLKLVGWVPASRSGRNS